MGSLVPSWPVPMGLQCLRLTMLMVLSVLSAMLVLDLLELQLPVPQLLLDKPTIAMLLEPQWLRTALNMESLDTGLFRPEYNRLLLDINTPLLDKRPSPSLLLLTLPELPRTLLRPDLLLPQPSLLPQHLMLPSPLLPSQQDLLPLTPLSRPRSLLPSEPTPESPLRSPTLSHKSMSRNTTLMFPLLSHVPFPVRSSRSLMSLSLMRFPSHVPSQSQLPTRFTPSRKLLRLPTSTTLHTRPTPARLL